MAKYYQTLSKNQKKEVNQKYKEDYQSSELFTRFHRLTIYTIIAILFGLFLIIYGYFFENKNIGSIIIGITLLILAIVFIIGKYLIKQNVLNKIALNIAKTKKK